LVGVPASAQASTTIIGVYSSMSTTLDKGTFTLTPPSSNSPGAWSYTSSKPSVATIVGNVATLHGAGITEITATQAASGSYASASRTTPLTVQRGTPTAPTWSNQSAQFSTGQYTIIPPTSVSTGTWTYTSSNPSIATVQGNTLYLNDGGVVTIHGIQSADVNWNQTSASMTFTSIAPVPTVGPFLNLSLPLYNISSVNLTAPTSTSSGPWVFTIDNPSVAALVGTTLTPLSAGTAIISAKQLPAASLRASRAFRISISRHLYLLMTSLTSVKNITTGLLRKSLSQISFSRLLQLHSLMCQRLIASGLIPLCDSLQT